MYSTDYRNLVDALMMDKYSIKFDKVITSILGTVRFVSFSYGRNSRYTIEVNIINYDTTMWYVNEDEHRLLLSSSTDDRLKELGKFLISDNLHDIMNATKKKD